MVQITTNIRSRVIPQQISPLKRYIRLVLRRSKNSKGNGCCIKGSDFDGDFSEFLTFLRTDPRFYFTNEEELLDGYRAICKKADAQLPKFFGRLPRLPYGVKAIPDYQATASPTAYYYSGNQKAGRSGYFMANTYKLETDQNMKWKLYPFMKQFLVIIFK